MATTPSTPTIDYRPRLVDAWLDELLEQLSGLMVAGPRAAGKTTTMGRRAESTVRLDREAEAAAFIADPDAALGRLAEPVLLDEWQVVPGVFGAARRAIEADPRPNRFLLTGSALADQTNNVFPGTGRIQRLKMFPMTVREQLGQIDGPTFFDKLAAGQLLTVPTDPPDIAGYVDLALASGFPAPALLLSGRARQIWLESYVSDLLTHDVEQVEDSPTNKRDTERLRSYFEAWALNTAGVLDHKRIYDVAKISKDTAAAYRQLLTDLLVIEEVPAWTSNRFKRLVHQPKRYMIDAALVASALRMNAAGVLADGDLLGRIIDTFVAAQLRPEIPVSETRPRLYHLRTKGGRQEIDLLAELAGQRLICIEVKAGAAPTKKEARHLAWLREEVGSRFVAGVVFHTGPQIYQLDKQIIAAPIAALWG
jgi:uncharacterized protein